jgi:hypothetical protein
VPNGQSAVQQRRPSLWKLKVAVPIIRDGDSVAVGMLAAAAEAAEQAAAAQRSDE